MLKIASRVLRGEQDAEDAVNNAFMSLAKNMKLVPELDSLKLRGFLYIVTENKAIDILRERKRRDVEESLDEDQPLYAPADDGECNLAWCISRMPPRYQEVILRDPRRP